MKIGFIGLGRMGSGKASRLLEAGHELDRIQSYCGAYARTGGPRRRTAGLVRSLAAKDAALLP